MVRWAYYKNLTTSITQCRNCFKFNHNAYECHMTPVCMLCAKQHKVEDCPHMIEKLAKNFKSVPEHLLRCINCQGNHTAIYQNCPARIKFLSKKQSTEAPRGIPAKPQQYIAAPPPPSNSWQHNPAPPPTMISWQTDQQLFPSLPQSQRRSRSATRTQLQTRPQIAEQSGPHNQPTAQQASAVDAGLHSHSHQTTENRGQYKPNYQTNDKTPNNFDNPNANLNNCFSAQELMGIFQEMLRTIATCRNKQEQLNALLTIAIKYMPCLD